ncbi:MAG: NAD-dependent epimerase/dehydratase family protein [Anaerolineales bacterium]
MILVTGGTGFIGQAAIRRLSEAGREIRILLRPSHRSPNLPQGIAVEVAIANLLDKRGVRAALVGVDSIIHLASAEARGREAGLQAVDVQGTAVLAEAALQAKVKRLIFVSHLGAELSSAFPVLRAKALAEQSIQRSSIPATILRSSLAYGPGDRFTSAIAMLLSISPLIFPLPGDGTTALQPIWVEDLATCILWALEEPAMVGQTYEIGGPEFLTVEQLTRLIKRVAGSRRWVVHASPASVRGLAWMLQRVLPRPPLTTFALDYLATSRMASLDALPRLFGLKPALLEHKLEYLQGRNWGWELLRRQVGVK